MKTLALGPLKEGLVVARECVKFFLRKYMPLEHPLSNQSIQGAFLFRKSQFLREICFYPSSTAHQVFRTDYANEVGVGCEVFLH